MNRKNAALVFIFIIPILSAGLLFYYRHIPTDPGRVEGFYSFQWGTALTAETEERLVNRFGTPHISYSGGREGLAEELKIRGFSVEQFYGLDLEPEAPTALFGFHEQEGLIHGILSFNVEENRRGEVIANLRQTLEENYPELEEFEPEAEMDNVILYRDGLTNSTITINHSADGGVRVIFNSPTLSEYHHGAT